jgi:hypothetical protein
MWFPSWQRNRNGSSARVRTLAPRFPRRQINFRPRTEALDERCLLNFGSSIATSVIGPVAMVTADVNNDGKADVIAATPGASGIAVMLGKGNGHLATPTYWGAGGNDTVKTLAVADVNGDGKLDIVTAGTETDLLLNNGEGTFGTAQKVGPAGSSVVVSDFNNDGRPDIAQIDAAGTSVVVILNAGTTTTGKGHK